MKLKSVQVMNYRNVEDSGKFSVGPLTCLVGKNEAGKTALLTALERVRPFNQEAKFDAEMQYPRRRLHDFRRPMEVVRTEWEMDDDDVECVEDELVSGCFTGRRLTVTRGYLGAKWEIPLDEKKVAQGILREAALSASEGAALKSCIRTEDIHAKIEGRENESPKVSALKERINKYPGNSARRHAIEILEEGMPKFLYFSHYDRMSGAVAFNSLAQMVDAKEGLDEGERVFLDFLKFAGVPLKQIPELAESYAKLKPRLEAASNKVTDQIFEYWSQNTRLEIEFDIRDGKPQNPPGLREGEILYARVKNNLHRASVDFSERSAGFIWFFSFLVHFARVKDEHGGDLVILLDEPGLTLHAKAQADLLRYIREKLLPEHQVIYTTHSPFMVPADDWPAVKVVEDVVEDKNGRLIPHGAKVFEDVLNTTADTVFPLQGALGYEITQTLFIGKHVLLVEGPSDFLYLRTLSAALEKAGKAGLSPEWTICPAGGIDKISPFVSLFSGENKLRVAALTDYAKGMKRKLEQIRESAKLSVHTYAEFCDGVDEADVEDVFGAAFYTQMVNKSLGLKGAGAISANDVDPSKRIIKEINRLMPSNMVRGLDHYTPADWLTRNPEILEDEIAKPALERFGRIFQTYNDILKRMKSG